MLRLEPLESREMPYDVIGGWYTTTLTYSFAGAPPAEYRAAVQSALSTWAGAAPLRFVEQPDSGPDLPWYQTYPGAGLPLIRFHPDAALTISYYPAQGDDDSRGEAGDVYLARSAAGPNLEGIALHEIGHALGLGHTYLEGQVMNAILSDPPLTRLQADDVEGIRSIYGTGVGSVTPLGSPELPISPPGDLPPPPPPTPIVAPGKTPADPFGGYKDYSTAHADLDGDGVMDAVFAADAQGHVRAFDGATGRPTLSFLVYPGFGGEVSLAAGGRTFAVVAQGQQGHLVIGDAGGALVGVLAFPGYAGAVRLTVNGETVEVAADAGGGHSHVKDYVGGELVRSLIG